MGYISRNLHLRMSTVTRRFGVRRGGYPWGSLFIQRPGVTGENDGVVVTVLLVSALERTKLMVLDAKNLKWEGRK